MDMTSAGFNCARVLLRPLAAASLLLAVAAPAFAASPDPAGDPAMIGYWKFDEGSGAAAADLSANSNTASLVNVGWSAAGKFNGAADLDATDYLDYNDEPELGLTNAVTLSAWVRYRTINYTESGGRIFGHGSNYSMIIGGPFSSSATLAVYAEGTDNAGWHRGRVLLSPNVWYHTAFTYDGSSVTIYVNGQVDSRVGVHGSMNPYTTGSAFSGWDPLAVAGYHAPLDGLLDEVAVYSRALSEGEIGGLYNWYVANSSSPAAVSSLTSAPGAYVGAMTLSWTAPAAAGAGGALASGSAYYLQYSTYSAAAWSTASAQVVRSTSAVAPGTLVRHVLGGLDPGTTYYAAVWHKDESGNFSAISNIATGYARQFPGGTFTRTVLGPDRWSLEFNSFYAGDDNAGGAAIDADGNIYVGCHVYNGANTDMALHKFSPDGTLLMAKYFNGEDNCSEGARPFPAVDNSDGSIYLAGHECRTAGPGAGLIIKFDRYGNRLWQRRVVGAGASAVQALTEAEIDTDGNIYVSGTLTNASNNADMYVGKFDRNGNQLWSNTLNSSANTEVFNSLVVAGTNVFVGGYSDQGAQSNNAYARKINGATGATQWTYSYNSAGNYSDGFTDLAAGPGGSVYFAGQTQVTPGDPDVLLQKRYSDGTVAWTRNHSFTTGFNEPVEGMAAPADGYFYTASMAQTTASNAHIAVTRFTQDGSLGGQLTYTQGVGRDGPRSLISAGSYLFFTGYVVIAGGSSNAYIRKIQTWEIPDPFAPAAVTGLGALALAPDKVRLNWQNPGDDGTSGTLYRSSFSVMHSAVLAFAEDQANWVPGSAQIVVSTTGVEAGALSFVEAGGLAADTTYYFRAWTKDDSGNYGPLSSGATSQTLAYAPSALAASVYVSSAALTWNAGGNQAWTGYEVSRSTDQFLLVFSTPSARRAGAAFTDSGLQPASTYYYRVRAINGQGVPTAFSSQLKVITNNSATSPSWLGANAVSSTSLVWVWPVAQEASGYRLEASTGGPVSGDLSAAVTSWTESGLLPNTPYSRTIAAFNVYGASVSVPVTRYTRAQVPSGLTVSAVYVTSAALTWSMGINPEGTVSHVERSTGGIYSQVVYEGSATVTLATGLQYCTDYDFAVKAMNGDGIGYDYSEVASARTKDHQALPPSGLSAEPLGNGRISLNWNPSASPHTNLYRLYYDEGDNSVDYSVPLAELPASATSYVTGVLASSAAYTFALRAVNRCGVEEANTHVLASAASVPALASVKASIKEPHSGKKVSGNRLTVIAELTQGEAYQADKVLFQFRAAGGVWGDIVPANANHPNPDLVAPYFVHWDVSGLAGGNYDLRAVAYDIYGASDTAPAAITVKVDNADFEVKETLQGDGKVKKEQLITNTITSEVSAADSEKAWVTKVAVPSGAVSASTVTLSIINNPTAAPSADAGLNPVGQATEISLSNGQHLLDNDQIAEVILTYPDDDGDGIVDGSFIRAERLKIYSYDSAAGAWKADLACRVDKEKRQVIGATPHFSYFAVFAPLAAAVSAARAYPNPWKPGSGGRFDAAAVTFDGLPSDALIQVFTIGGDLVRELRVTAADSGVKTWNGLNTSGSKAASGVYLVLVRSGGKTKTFKLGVER